MVKRTLNILLAIKMLKIDLYAYSFQKWVHIEEILIKLNECLFFIEDEKMSQKYNEISKKVSNIIKTEFDNNPVYHKKYLKIKTKSYNGKISTNFHNNKMPKEGS